MKEIFNNPIPTKLEKKAKKQKEKFKRKYAEERSNYHYQFADQEVLSLLGTKNLKLSQTPLDINQIKNPFIVGNIRMGFGHYRISMAIASAAYSMGYTPIWFDLNSFPDSRATKIISSQNDLYSLGSRISGKSKLFNKLIWEPLNYEGFRQLKQNVNDQYVAELFTPMYEDFDKDTPFVATHVWPAQGAIHAGMRHVVNAIPDNWQMALHLSEGSIHTIQTHNSFFGYKNLRGMDKKNCLKPMKDLVYTGHYIDHELVSNIETDCEERIKRVKAHATPRYLLTVGGAGSQQELFKELIAFLSQKNVCIFVNVGDHKNVFDYLLEQFPQAIPHINAFDEIKELSTTNEILPPNLHLIYHEDIFRAVYSTNLLMHCSDLLLTKPSELAFYPIPKLFTKRVGGHERWGAIHSAEIGDGTYECTSLDEITQMCSTLLNEPEILIQMNKNIIRNKSIGIYDGAYEVVRLATKK